MISASVALLAASAPPDAAGRDRGEPVAGGVRRTVHTAAMEGSRREDALTASIVHMLRRTTFGPRVAIVLASPELQLHQEVWRCPRYG